MKAVMYRFLYIILRPALFLWHPVFLVSGRENIPPDGRLMICANHSGLSDPLWVIFAMREKKMPFIMAKKEVKKIPILNSVCKAMDVIPIDRGNIDIEAVKKCLRVLANEEHLMIFPEGTRWKKGKIMEPKRGALTLAARADCPILPIYLSRKRFPFSPMKCVIGEPYKPVYASRKPSDEELQNATDALMKRIYTMGGYTERN